MGVTLQTAHVQANTLLLPSLLTFDWSSSSLTATKYEVRGEHSPRGLLEKLSALQRVGTKAQSEELATPETLCSVPPSQNGSF